MFFDPSLYLSEDACKAFSLIIPRLLFLNVATEFLFPGTGFTVLQQFLQTLNHGVG
jgi:hypothetical protein